MPKVYVVQENRKHNLGPAMRYGELVALLPEDDGIVLSTAPTIRRLRSALRNFSNDDFLVLSGDPVAIGLAAMVASDINNGRVNMLKWNKSAQQYFPVRADVHLRPADEVRA